MFALNKKSEKRSVVIDALIVLAHKGAGGIVGDNVARPLMTVTQLLEKLPFHATSTQKNHTGSPDTLTKTPRHEINIEGESGSERKRGIESERKRTRAKKARSPYSSSSHTHDARGVPVAIGVLFCV